MNVDGDRGHLVFQEVVEGDKKMIYYVKLHVIWDTLCRKAEDMCLRAPLQVRATEGGVWEC